MLVGLNLPNNWGISILSRLNIDGAINNLASNNDVHEICDVSMKKSNKTLSMVLTVTILFSVMMSLSNVAAQGEMPPVETVNQNQYQGSIAGNSSSQYMFRNRFQFQIRTNQSVELDMNVDVDNVGDREFALELNTSEAVHLEVQIKASDSELGLEEGNAVQHQNQNQYQHQYKYQEQFQVNLTIKEDCDIQARLSINTDDSNAKWAYFDEDTEEFVIADSTYKDGVLTAETDHFSVWTVLTVDNSIPAFTALGGVLGLGVLGLVFITKRKQ